MVRLESALWGLKQFSLLSRLVVCLVVLVPVTALGQNAELSGKVEDPTHAAVPGAVLAITQDATGVVQQTQSNGQGAYFVSLQPGSYSIDVTMPGFKKVHRQDVVLVVAQPARLDFVLEVGSDTQVVNVEGGTEALQESISVGTTIEEDEIARLPVNGVDGRNYTALITLTPGASDVSVSGGDGTISGTTLYSVNGQRNQDNNYTLDGIDNNFLHKQSPGLSPSMDALKEFRVATNNTVEYGRSAGANIALVTKSGTKDIHGSAYEFSRQAGFDANDWFNDHNQIAKQPFHYNLFGVSAGGPVVLPGLYHGRAKTFWFFSYEGFRRRQSNAVQSNVPTAAERAGDFSAIKQTIYDPLTGVVNPKTGVVGRTPFPNNQIPKERLDPVALAYINDFVPLPNLPAGVIPIGNANYINVTPQRNDRDQFVARFDHHLNSRNLVFVRVLRQGATQKTPQALPTYEEDTSFSGMNYAVGWDVVPNTKSLLQVRFGYNNPQGPDMTRNKLGITRTQFFAATGVQIFTAFAPDDVLPTINAQDFTLSETGGTSVDQVFEGNAIYMRTAGNSVWKFGVSLEPRHYYHDATSPTSGTATFAVTQTNGSGLTSDTKTGSGTASFLLGYPSAIDRGQGGSDVDATQTVYAAFAAYNHKFGKKLTVDLGVRYEFYKPAADKQDRLGTIWIHNDPVSGSVTGSLLWAGTNPLPDPVSGVVNQPANQQGFGRGLAQTNSLNFMPRVGVSYLVDWHTIVRAGFGIYDNSTAFQEVQDERKFYPYNFEQTFTTNDGPLPNTKLTNTGPAYSSLLNLGGFAQDPGKKTPYSEEYNLTLQHQFAANFIAQAAYVGSSSKHLVGYEPANTAPLPDPNTQDLPGPRLLLPQFGYFYQGANRYKANYNALQLLLRRRYHAGFQVQANYTYSRSLDNQSSLGEMKTQNPFNLRESYSRSSYDLTHIFNLSFVYDLPFGRGRMFGTHWLHLVDDFIGGWSLESINRYETGPPVNVTLGGLDIANTGYGGSTAQRPNVTGDPNKVSGGKTVTQWFNTAAFTAPAGGTYGNSRPFTIHSDAIRRTDLSVYKRFFIVDRQSLDFRGEFFNLPNTPSFGPPKVNFESQGSFGTVGKVSVNARQVQLALRYTF